jgi:hypothetical protein
VQASAWCKPLLGASLCLVQANRRVDLGIQGSRHPNGYKKKKRALKGSLFLFTNLFFTLEQARQRQTIYHLPSV